MQYQTDILLNSNDDFDVADGDFVIGESVLQEVGIIIRLTSGQLKSDPVLAPNLVQLVKGKADSQKIEDRLRISLQRDNKDYKAIREILTFKMK